MILHNNKEKAFTIVELLIVIVVIGILAAISIVAYNGIQDRSRDTSVKNAASQVRNKVESWNSIKGAYPTAAQVAAGLDHDSTVQEAYIDSGVETMITTGTIATAHSANSAGTILVANCGSTGFRITYYQKTVTNPVIRLGTGC